PPELWSQQSIESLDSEELVEEEPHADGIKDETGPVETVYADDVGATNVEPAAAPVEATHVEAAPVEAAPVEPTPVPAAPAAPVAAPAEPPPAHVAAIAELLHAGRAVLVAGPRLCEPPLTLRDILARLVATLSSADVAEVWPVLQARPLSAAGFVVRRLGDRF